MMSRSTIALLFLLCLLALFEGAQAGSGEEPPTTVKSTALYSTLGAFATVLIARIF